MKNKILLQNLFTRGFPKQADSSKTSRTPVKRRSDETPISRFKKLVIDDEGNSSIEFTSSTKNTRVAEVTPIKDIRNNTSDTSTSDENHQIISDVTPTKRKLSVVIEKLHSPFKRLNLAEKEPSTDLFKIPEPPATN